MNPKVIYSTRVEFPIAVTQYGPDSFRLVYGEDIKTGSHDDIAKALGYAIFHGLECQGKLDSA